MIKAVKNYFFWRKYRWYRKDEMCQALIKNRIYLRITFREGLQWVNEAIKLKLKRKKTLKVISVFRRSYKNAVNDVRQIGLNNIKLLEELWDTREELEDIKKELAKIFCQVDLQGTIKYNYFDDVMGNKTLSKAVQEGFDLLRNQKKERERELIKIHMQLTTEQKKEKESYKLKYTNLTDEETERLLQMIIPPHED